MPPIPSPGPAVMVCLRLIRAAALCACLLAATLLGATPALARPAMRTVVYRGLTLHVPGGWPVISLARRPTTCVRFNRHAVYLGLPGQTQDCPPQGVGRTEAIVVSPARAASAVTPPAGGATLRRHGLAITVTWNRHPGLVARMLGLRSVPRPAPIAAEAALRMTADLRERAARMVAHVARAGYTGLGFDTCSTPSAAQLAAWGTSPYRGIGVYIGGVNSACAQANLTAAWVAQAAREGWHLVLTYVGLQAPRNSCGCASIAPARAAAQGAAAADDAVARAAAIGIGSGAPIYFDMENYATTARNETAVLAFLAAWTTELHRHGDRSGVYSSASSGVANLLARYGTGFAEPDDLWFADWNGQPTTLAGYLPSTVWAAHQRVHQYRGDHRARYGGVTLDIDSDAIDAATAGAAGSAGPATVSSTATSPVSAGAPAGRPGTRRPTAPSRGPGSGTTSGHPVSSPPAPAATPPQNGAFVEISGTGAVYRIVGGAPMFVRYWDDVGGPQPVAQISPATFDALRAVPADGSVIRTDDGAIYVIAGGYPFALPAAPAGAAAILVDIWDIENLASPLSHLNPTPADGTIVIGQPSATAWIFEGGQLNPAPSPATGTPVDDASLTVWPQAAPAAAPGAGSASGAGAASGAGSSGDGSSSGAGWPAGNWSWPG